VARAGIYVAVIYYLPNRAYYDTVSDLNEAELKSNLAKIAIYALLEGASFVLLSILLRRRLGISSIRQLGFAIESQWHMTQSKFIMWVVFTVQSQLEHAGVDFSFQFEWLRSRPA